MYPLHKAAREGRYEDLKELLDSGKHDVNEATFELVRPLHDSCGAGQFHCAQLLIQYGANVNLPNIDGATALCDACSSGCIKCVKLLLEEGANVNPPFLFTTPAHECVFKDNWPCLELLLSCGADPDRNDCHFGTPLHLAACRGHQKSAMVLLQCGANPNSAKTHNTPLHYAARGQDLCLIKLLLEFGANVYSEDSRGYTARQLVPCTTSVCKKFLLDWEKTPKSLSHHCRLAIRQTLGRDKLKQISELPLPKRIVHFLLHYE